MKKFRFGMIFVVALVLVSLFTVSCKTTSVAIPETEDRMYWKIEGTDSKGNPSTVHLLGTIHVGDERLYPLPEQIMTDFENSDRLVAELSSEDLGRLQGELVKALLASAMRARGKNVIDQLSDKEREILFSVLNESIARPLGIYEPWILTDTVSVFQYSSCGLDSSKGVDQYLMDKAREKGRSWEGLDTLQLQIDVMQFGTYEEQLAVLKSMLTVLEDPTIFNLYINTLYEAYIAGDIEGVLRADEVGNDEVEKASGMDKDPEFEEYSKKYDEQLLTKRNRAWADKIKKCLNEGGETFIFAGCLHFIGKDSVFEFLRKNGTLKN